AERRKQRSHSLGNSLFQEDSRVIGHRDTRHRESQTAPPGPVRHPDRSPARPARAGGLATRGPRRSRRSPSRAGARPPLRYEGVQGRYQGRGGRQNLSEGSKAHQCEAGDRKSTVATTAFNEQPQTRPIARSQRSRAGAISACSPNGPSGPTAAVERQSRRWLLRLAVFYTLDRRTIYERPRGTRGGEHRRWRMRGSKVNRPTR